ncbi:hypothetical protein GQ543_11005 [candidate division WOR-3 bacterium]|nr:hypothetical protein [candidate division WOR-3 bacterium]
MNIRYINMKGLKKANNKDTETRENGACGAGLATALMQSAGRLWFTSVNGYGSYERE